MPTVHPNRPQLLAPLTRIGLTLGAFLLGTYGFGAAYHQLNGHAGSLAANAFRSLQLVIGKFPDELSERSLPLSLDIARYALPLLTFWTTVALAWVQVRNPVRTAWLTRRGGQLVIAGDEGVAAAIATAEREARRPVVLWDADPGRPWIARLADRGAPVVAATDPVASAQRLGLSRARAVLLLGEDDNHNLARAADILAAVADRPAGEPLPVVVRVDDIDLRRASEERIATAAVPGVRVRLVSLADIAGRELFTDRPLDRFRRLDQAARPVFLLGFAPAQERYLLRMLAGAHFREGGKPTFVVFSPDAAQRERVFRARRPGADALAPVIFQPADADEPSLVPGLLGEAIATHGAPVAIVVDGADRARALAVAYAVDGHFRAAGQPAPPIHVRADVPTIDAGSAIFPFGVGRENDTELVLQERHDALAQSVHEFYLEGRLTDGEVLGTRISLREWDDLPESVRDDNRLLADCYQNKLRDLGARLVPGASGGLRLDETEVEELSRAEHDRWMAAKLIDGWVHGDQRDDGARRHPDIVPYDALSEPVKELDREQIRMMTKLLPRTGAVPRRVMPLALVPAQATGSGQALVERLTALAADYPDRVLIPVGDMADPGVRHALIAAHAAGYRVQLVAAGNLETLIAALPAAERAAALLLAREADTIFVGGAAPAPAMVLAVAADGRVA